MDALCLNVVVSVWSNVSHNAIYLPLLGFMVLNCDVRSDLNIGEGFGMLIVGHFQCLFCADGLFLYILGVALPFS